MLSKTRQKLDQFKNILLRQQLEVEEELKNVKKEDPLYDGTLSETSEPGTDSWIADVHSSILAVKENLNLMLTNIKSSLKQIDSGNYGKCQKCGKEIEVARLKAMPTATVCVACSKKFAKK